MRKNLILILTSLLLFSCNKDPKQKLVGEWKEHWGVGQETDVTYTDTIKIELSTNNEIILKCTNENNYLYDKILFDGTELSFRNQNTVDPKEKFYMYYKMKMSEDGNWMEGPLNNSKNQSDFVKWEKIR